MHFVVLIPLSLFFTAVGIGVLLYLGLMLFALAVLYWQITLIILVPSLVWWLLHRFIAPLPPAPPPPQEPRFWPLPERERPTIQPERATTLYGEVLPPRALIVRPQDRWPH